MNKYFIPSPKTCTELKSQYRKLAYQHHPDRSDGCTEVMKLINNEYDILFEKLKHLHVNASGDTYTKDTTETAGAYKDIISKLIHLDNISIEIIGTFIWISGDTRPIKELLKALKFRYAPKKSMWYLAPDDYSRSNKSPWDIEKIRAKYGCVEIETKKVPKVSA